MLPDLSCTHALLLQGPAGPFFRRFADELRAAGIRVTKVNLHAGDAVFFRGPGVVPFRGTARQWPGFVRELIGERRIDALFLFGDCRPYHRRAIEVARELGVAVWAFEEGYLRPDYVTLEREGVNGHSTMPRDPELFRRMARELPEPDPPESPGPSLAPAAGYSIVNATAMTFFNRGYPHYEHHRDMHALRQAGSWLRSATRKVWYSVRERDLLDDLSGRRSVRYFFVPLQVHCDFQLLHSPYADVPDFIREVVATFADHAPEGDSLVLKHHPMDRAYREYGPLVRDLAERHGLGDRLVYVHDLHLPTLLKNARGTVTINSTVGLSSLHHGTPVKVMGTAVYDVPGLTHPGSLADFFRDPGTVDRELYEGFRRYVAHVNQANGNLYRRLPGRRHGTGMRWFRAPDPARAPTE